MFTRISLCELCPKIMQTGAGISRSGHSNAVAPRLILPAKNQVVEFIARYRTYFTNLFSMDLIQDYVFRTTQCLSIPKITHVG